MGENILNVKLSKSGLLMPFNMTNTKVSPEFQPTSNGCSCGSSPVSRSRDTTALDISLADTAYITSLSLERNFASLNLPLLISSISWCISLTVASTNQPVVNINFCNTVSHVMSSNPAPKSLTVCFTAELAALRHPLSCLRCTSLS